MPSLSTVERGQIPDVGVRGQNPPVQRFHLRHGLLEVFGARHRVRRRLHLRAHVDGDDVRPLLGQADGVASTLADALLP